MSRLALLVGLGGLVAAAAGCQTFIGVEDVQAHLPRLDGTYLMTISRVRAQGGAEDKIRMRTMASLDHGTRTLDLSYAILDFDSDAAVAEGAIADLEFPADSASVAFQLNLQIPAMAVDTPAPTGVDASVVADMVLRAEAEYSFCARPADDRVAKPTLGTVLLTPPGVTLPTGANIDLDCDE